MKFNSKHLKEIEEPLCVALSMGVDSLAVLHFLKTKYPKRDISAFHFNHNLRGQNFEMEGKAIRFCAKYQIPLVVKRRNLHTHKDTYEAALRNARYEAMGQEVSHIVTGHHLDDAVENYLFNCFNGTPEHLPIPEKTVFTEFDNLTVLRPFLLTKKVDMLKYVKQNELIEWIIEDETNKNQDYRRNWLRHTIIPHVNSVGYNLHKIVKKKYLKNET